MIRKLLPLTFAMVLAVTLRLGAGGWAVVTLDTLPESAVASTPLRLSFTVRQHGQTLWTGCSRGSWPSPARTRSPVTRSQADSPDAMSRR